MERMGCRACAVEVMPPDPGDNADDTGRQECNQPAESAPMWRCDGYGRFVDAIAAPI